MNYVGKSDTVVRSIAIGQCVSEDLAEFTGELPWIIIGAKLINGHI
jgi:hypothetical protein